MFRDVPDCRFPALLFFEGSTQSELKKCPNLVESRKSPRKKNNSNYFLWTDDEVELLLKVAMDYEASKTIESIDWESSLSRYQDILDKF